MVFKVLAILFSSVLVASAFRVARQEEPRWPEFFECNQGRTYNSLTLGPDNGPAIFRSSNFGKGDYSNGDLCIIQFAAGESYVLDLTFKSFGLENDDDCWYDTFCLDGEKYCGNDLENKTFSYYIPAGNTFTVAFRTDHSITAKGFELYALSSPAIEYDSGDPYEDRCYEEERPGDHSSPFPLFFTESETLEKRNHLLDVNNASANDDYDYTDYHNDADTDDHNDPDTYDHNDPDTYDHNDPDTYDHNDADTDDHNDPDTYDHNDPDTYDHNDPDTYDHNDPDTYDHNDADTDDHNDPDTYDHNDPDTYDHNDPDTYDHNDPDPDDHNDPDPDDYNDADTDDYNDADTDDHIDPDPVDYNDADTDDYNDADTDDHNNADTDDHIDPDPGDYNDADTDDHNEADTDDHNDADTDDHNDADTDDHNDPDPGDYNDEYNDYK